MKNADSIQAAHDALGHHLGWKFLYSPVSTLTEARVAFIGLNPGGAKYEAPVYAQPPGQSAYLDESWRGHAAGTAPYQFQVRELFRMVGVHPQAVLAGNLVPFRSPRWAALERRQESLAFGCELWREVFAAHVPELVVCLGGITDRALGKLLGAGTATHHDVAWGNVTATVRDFDGGRLIKLPHLSTFKLFSRGASKECLLRIFYPAAEAA